MTNENGKMEISKNSLGMMKDPGASRYGNFINYYTFHSAEERARQLPRGALQPTDDRGRKFVGLDIGCNAGDLTFLLHEYLREEIKSSEIRLLGIDIDELLIERAQDNNSLPDHLSFKHLDFMSEECRGELVGYLEKFQRQRFDIIFCFSVTMWIHVNHGDEGLIRFLKTICSMTETIIIEPQLWKCYRNASRRLRRAGDDDFPLLNSLKLTGDIAGHIDKIIQNCSFRSIGISEANEWGRKLLIYERIR